MEGDLAQGADGGVDVAVTWKAHDIEEGCDAGHRRALIEQAAYALDPMRGPLGKVGEGGFFDPFLVAAGLAQMDGGGVAWSWRSPATPAPGAIWP